MDIGANETERVILAGEGQLNSGNEVVTANAIAPIDCVQKPKCKIFETFSKLWVSILMINAIVDMNLSYVLAFLGREQIAETLSIAVVTEIIGVMTAYLFRAFLDSHFEAKDAFEHKKLDVWSIKNSLSNSTIVDDEMDEDEDEFDENDDEEADG